MAVAAQVPPLVEPGEHVHIVERRLLDSDARRHFVGRVEARDGLALRVSGYLWVFDGASSRFVRKPGRRVRLIALDNRMVVNVIPRDVDLDALRYAVNPEGNLVVADGGRFELDINEFSPVQ